VDKIVSSAADAIADIAPGAVVAIAGFGVPHRWPSTLVIALREAGTSDLTVVCNALGMGPLSPHILAENRQVSRLIAAFSTVAGMPSVAEEQIAAGQMAFELVPQGTLVERLRAAGAGIGAFYTRTGVGTPVADGKETREIDGVPYVLETALPVDVALIRARQADAAGNVAFAGASQNFAPSFARGASLTIVEADEIVPIGAIPPERVDLPGIFVDRVVASAVGSALTPQMMAAAQRQQAPIDQARSYLGRPGLSRELMALRTARLLRPGSYVNLGIGMPTLVGNFLFESDVTLHAENGILGYGASVDLEQADPDLYNAGGQLVTALPGASFFDSVAAFEMARGGHVDTVILGGFQVDAAGNLANWSTPQMAGGGVGGAMDLVAGGAELIVLMEHADRGGNPKVLRQCSYPLTGVGCVDVIVTDLALIRVTPGGLVLEEVAPGFTPQEVASLTDAPLIVPDTVPDMV
jgi:3-oxoacid CoA-transferase